MNVWTAFAFLVVVTVSTVGQAQTVSSIVFNGTETSGSTASATVREGTQLTPRSFKVGYYDLVFHFSAVQDTELPLRLKVTTTSSSAIDGVDSDTSSCSFDDRSGVIDLLVSVPSGSTWPNPSEAQLRLGVSLAGYIASGATSATFRLGVCPDDLDDDVSEVFNVQLLDKSSADLGTFDLTVTDDDDGDPPVAPNRAPVAVGSVSAMSLVVGEAKSFSVAGYFRDPDGDELVYSVSSSPVFESSWKARSNSTTCPAHGITPTSDLCIKGAGPGTAQVTVTATDPAGLSVDQTFDLSVARNIAPRVTAVINPRSVGTGTDNDFDIDLRNHFVDANGHALTFSAESSDTGVLTATVSDSDLHVNPDSTEGSATVTVRATDPVGDYAETSFVVVVGTPPAFDAPTRFAPAFIRFSGGGSASVGLSWFSSPRNDAASPATGFTLRYLRPTGRLCPAVPTENPSTLDQSGGDVEVRGRLSRAGTAHSLYREYDYCFWVRRVPDGPWSAPAGPVDLSYETPLGTVPASARPTVLPLDGGVNLTVGGALAPPLDPATSTPLYYVHWEYAKIQESERPWPDDLEPTGVLSSIYAGRGDTVPLTQDIDNGKTYIFKIRYCWSLDNIPTTIQTCRNAWDISPWSQESPRVTPRRGPDAAGPGVPRNVELTAEPPADGGELGTLTFRWDEPANADEFEDLEYHVQRRLRNGAYGPWSGTTSLECITQGPVVTVLTCTRISWNAAEAGEAYYARVRSDAGDGAARSSWIEVGPVTVPPHDPLRPPENLSLLK